MLLDQWRVAQDRSVVGPGDVEVHLRRAEDMAAVVPPAARAVDLGSGAGIPGLALAGLWPDSHWVLLDAALRRVQLLQQSVRLLGWDDRVEVLHGRAEELGRDRRLRGTADLVTSRSFGPPAVVAECGAPFLRVGGVLAVTEPPGSAGTRWPAEGLHVLGLRADRLEAGIQLLVAETAVSETYPRRPGIPVKRPLF